MSTVTVTVDRKQAEKLTTYYGDADCDCAPCQIARNVRSALDASDARDWTTDSEEIPDKVIEEATLIALAAGWPEESPFREGSASMRFMAEIMRKVAPVIAAWVRQQERERVGRAYDDADAALEDVDADDDDERAYREGKVHALAALFRELRR